MNFSENPVNVSNDSNSNFSEDELFDESVINFEFSELALLDDSSLDSKSSILNSNSNLSTNQNEEIKNIYLKYMNVLKKKNSVIEKLNDSKFLDLSCNSIVYYESLIVDINALKKESSELSVDIDKYIELYYSDEVVKNVTQENIVEISLVLNELDNISYNEIELNYLSLKGAC